MRQLIGWKNPCNQKKAGTPTRPLSRNREGDGYTGDCAVVARKSGWVLAGLLAVAFAAVTAVIGWLALRACGLSIPGIGPVLNTCEVPAPPPPPPAADEAETARNLVLMQTLADLERQFALTQTCPLPPPPPTPRAEARQRPRNPQPQACQIRRTENVVLMLDASPSMEWSYNVPADLERRAASLGIGNQGLMGLLQGFFGIGPMSEAERLTREIQQIPGDRRIDLAKSALTALVDVADPNVSFEFVSFASCGPPMRLGNFGLSERARLKKEINGTALRPSTALAQAITELASIVPRTPAASQKHVNVVLISDGFDSCGGDPCAAAAALEQQRPEIDINVLAASRAIPELSCISQKTGGRFLQPSDTSQIASLVRAAAGQARGEPCP